ncbi:hypothetical protein SCUCBS95973_007024 [Sporothrix curviconia]|uniref:Uncharacterized protein n=1 Tax=Sporothrix curviconia TaxID=1260050 RepID=A0ABP0CCJ3_9PEZI
MPFCNTLRRDRGGCFAPNCEIEASIEEMVETNQTQHLQYCTETEEEPYLTLMLGKLCHAERVYSKHYLFCKRPVSENGGQWSLLRRRALENATELQNLYNTAVASPLLAPFVWHIGRHTQLHATLHILNELSATSPDTLTDQIPVRQICEAAWVSVEGIERPPVVAAASQQDRQQQASGAVFRVLERLREAARRHWAPDRTMFDPYSDSFAILDASNLVPDVVWNMQAWPSDFGVGTLAVQMEKRKTVSAAA